MDLLFGLIKNENLLNRSIFMYLEEEWVFPSTNKIKSYIFLIEYRLPFYKKLHYMALIKIIIFVVGTCSVVLEEHCIFHTKDL